MRFHLTPFHLFVGRIHIFNLLFYLSWSRRPYIMTVLPCIFLMFLSFLCVNLATLLNLCESRVSVLFSGHKVMGQRFQFLFLKGSACGIAEPVLSVEQMWYCDQSSQKVMLKQPQSAALGKTRLNIPLTRHLNIMLAVLTELNRFPKRCNLWHKQSRGAVSQPLYIFLPTSDLSRVLWVLAFRGNTNVFRLTWVLDGICGHCLMALVYCTCMEKMSHPTLFQNRIICCLLRLQ